MIEYLLSKTWKQKLFIDFKFSYLDFVMIYLHVIENIPQKASFLTYGSSFLSTKLELQRRGHLNLDQFFLERLWSTRLST